VAFLTLLCATTSAAAQESNNVLARRHFQRADLLYRQSDFRGALKHYKKALSYKRHPAVFFNIAQCHRQLGEYKHALFYYKLYRSELPNAPNRDEVDRRIKEMAQKIAETERLEKQKGRLSVVTQPPGAQIFIDRVSGRPTAKSPAIVKLTPGQHLVVIKARGFADVHRKVTITTGKLELLELVLKPPRARKVPRARPGHKQASSAKAGRRSSPFYKRWWFWTGASIALAAVATATYTGITTLNMEKQWEDNRGPPPGDPDFESRYKRYRLSTDLLIGVAALAAVGITIGALVVGKGRAERPSAVIVPGCAAHGCGLSITGRF
jgi:hypothetical protein